MVERSWLTALYSKFREIEGSVNGVQVLCGDIVGRFTPTVPKIFVFIWPPFTREAIGYCTVKKKVIDFPVPI
jgi:hypothetical protein